MTAGPGSDGDGLAVLAERLDAVRGQVDELARRVTTAEAGIQGLGTSVAEAASLAQEVTRLSETLAAGPGGAGPAMTTVHPRRPPWRFMSDDQYREGLRDLARWVTSVLFARYPYTIRVLPACWPLHSDAVEELDVLYWLWAQWAVPGEDEDDRGRDAADWHDRWLPGALARLEPQLRTCAGQGDHAPPPAGRVTRNRERPVDWPELMIIETGELARVPRPS